MGHVNAYTGMSIKKTDAAALKSHSGVVLKGRSEGNLPSTQSF